MNRKVAFIGQQVLDLLVVLLLGVGAVAIAVAYSPFHQHPFALMFLFFVLAVWYGDWWQACLGLCETVLATLLIFNRYGDLNAEVLLFVIASISLILVVHSQRVSRMRLLEALDNARLLQGRHNAILDNAPNGVISFEVTGKIVEFTRPAELLFGYTAQEVLGVDLAQLFDFEPSSDAEADYKTFTRRILGTPFEVKGVRSDGHRFTVEAVLIRYEMREGPAYSMFVNNRPERLRSFSGVSTIGSNDVDSSKPD
jgi:PAS domain S-box-containing protein